MRIPIAPISYPRSQSRDVLPQSFILFMSRQPSVFKVVKDSKNFIFLVKTTEDDVSCLVLTIARSSGPSQRGQWFQNLTLVELGPEKQIDPLPRTHIFCFHDGECWMHELICFSCDSTPALVPLF